MYVDPVVTAIEQVRTQIQADILAARGDMLAMENRLTQQRRESDDRHERTQEKAQEANEKRFSTIEKDVRELMAFRWKFYGACVGMPVLTGLIIGALLKGA
jgi:Skp family chaperone for outer membrane proteins